MKTSLPLSIRILAGAATALLLVPVFGLMVALYFITPPLVFWAALVVWVLLGVWYFLRRRGASPASAGNWSSLVGTHRAKDGLL